MPRISDTDAAWVALTFNQTVIHVSLYVPIALITGFYAAIVFMSTWILLQKGLRYSYARLALLLTTIIMFGLSTAYVVLFVTFFKIQFPTLTSESVPDNPDWLIAKEQRLYIALLVMRRVSVSLEDPKCDVVHMAWQHLVRLYLIIVLLATAATSIATAIMDSLGTLDGFSGNLLGTFCLLLTNFSTTVLCAYKVWQYRRFIKMTYGQARRKKTLVESILVIVVESGAIYCIFWLLLLLGDFGKTWDSDYALELFMPHFSGIYVALIILVVALSKTSSESFFSGVDRDVEYEDPRKHKLETMQFAVPKTRVTSTVARDTSGSFVETENLKPMLIYRDSPEREVRM
ncbi:hypothetical protein BDZ89DRAFT_1131657 [Hymenopellis radicata]|nr:hypothetical protein BDZ89DRAFT_1131657 [Hymenopellis radicata]